MDAEADERAMRDGEAAADAGLVAPHAEVAIDGRRRKPCQSPGARPKHPPRGAAAQISIPVGARAVDEDDNAT